MEFRTPIHLKPSSIRMDHNTKILTMGSCFANVMGGKLHAHKFQVKINPFGVIFNPLSIFRVLLASLKNGDGFFKDSYIKNKDIWYNYHLHSDFNAPTEEELHHKVIQTLKDFKEYIQTTNILTITFGTAFIYRLIQNKEIVANCHKLPAYNFQKELLAVKDITEEFEKVYSEIKRINPSVCFILTLSPVRHIKDGIEQNSISKAILRSACHLIQEKHKDTEYFPSYEIMMDDLRDYRFYKEDMIHPSEVAENYIWEKFMERYVEKNSIDLIKEWGNIRRALEHKPFHPESETYKTFLNETITKLRKLSTVINVEEELKALQNKLNK